MNFRVGQGYDVHRLAEGETLWLGGILIPHHKGTVAHSDGDVVIHAVCDALLGAAKLRDIGTHFPDNSAEFKNIDSKILLKKSYDLVKEKGYEIDKRKIEIEEPIKSLGIYGVNIKLHSKVNAKIKVWVVRE